MDSLRLAAAEEHIRHEIAMTRTTDAEKLAAEIEAENGKYEVQQQAYARDIAALDKNGKDYEVKLKQIQDRETELEKEHANKVQQIKDQAAQQAQAKQQQALSRMENGFAQSFLHVLQGHQSFAGAMSGISQQIVSNILQEAIAQKAGLESTKMAEAEAAARKMYLAGAHFPWPTNVVMAPLLGALGFATMMAFESGGIVPGVGRGDTVPALLEPGESVLPKRLTEGLTHAAQHGGGEGGGKHVHVHHHATYNVQAFDSSGVDAVLEQHSQKFSDHVTRELRKRNM
jgi:hypothetical protein